MRKALPKAGCFVWTVLRGWAARPRAVDVWGWVARRCGAVPYVIAGLDPLGAPGGPSRPSRDNGNVSRHGHRASSEAEVAPMPMRGAVPARELFRCGPLVSRDVAGGSKPQHRLARPRGGGGGGVDSGSIFLPWAHAHLGSFAASHCGLPPRCPSEFVPCRPGQVPAIGLLGRPRLGSVTA